jgi:uncharacterized protein YjbJ (UPF0337 family)
MERRQAAHSRDTRIKFCQGRNNMNRSTEDQATGTLHEVKGNVKEKIGQLTNDPDLEGEGIGEKVAGKIQKKIGQIEKVIEKP